MTLTCLHQEVGYMVLPNEPIVCSRGGSGWFPTIGHKRWYDFHLALSLAALTFGIMLRPPEKRHVDALANGPSRAPSINLQTSERMSLSMILVPCLWVFQPRLWNLKRRTKSVLLCPIWIPDYRNQEVTNAYYCPKSLSFGIVYSSHLENPWECFKHVS